MFVFLKLPMNTGSRNVFPACLDRGTCLHEAPHTHISSHSGEGTHRGAAAGIEQEVGGVGCGRRLVGDRPVAQRHPHDRRHVGLRAKDVDGDPRGLPWGSTQEQSASSGESSTKVRHLTP